MYKCEPELSLKIEEGKMLAPRPTRDGKAKTIKAACLEQTAIGGNEKQ